MKYVMLSMFSLFGVLFLLQPVNAEPEPFDPFAGSCEVDGTGDAAICNERVDGNTDPLAGENGAINQIANIIAIFAGVVAVIIIIIAGITMILSGGDSTKVQNSRNAIIYAAVGLVVIVLARGIVALVINLV
jgi:hypothetical protein